MESRFARHARVRNRKGFRPLGQRQGQISETAAVPRASHLPEFFRAKTLAARKTEAASVAGRHER
jgi:hypothetical protein